ncbi:hypothetical protein ACSBR1_013198 [Camellia fascicularis]
MESRSKCQKLSEEVKLKEAEDRINNLPRCIVCHILSFLPTKYAVGTSILSTKWKHMWTSIRNLECFKFSDVLHVNAWVTAALLRNVRELDIYIHSPRVLKPSTLGQLDLGLMSQLKDSFLAALSLRFWFYNNVVEKRLKVIGYRPPNNYKYRIELNTPNLPHLEYRDLVAEGYAMKNLSSLVKAHIDLQSCWGEYKDYYQTSVTEFFQGISTVRTLHMSGPCVELPPPSTNSGLFHNLTPLELGININNAWELLGGILESSPNLRTLVFVEDWDPPDRVPTCLLESLCDDEDMLRREWNARTVENEVIENAKGFNKL